MTLDEFKGKRASFIYSFETDEEPYNDRSIQRNVERNLQGRCLFNILKNEHLYSRWKMEIVLQNIEEADVNDVVCIVDYIGDGIVEKFVWCFGNETNAVLARLLA